MIFNPCNSTFARVKLENLLFFNFACSKKSNKEFFSSCLFQMTHFFPLLCYDERKHTVWSTQNTLDSTSIRRDSKLYFPLFTLNRIYFLHQQNALAIEFIKHIEIPPGDSNAFYSRRIERRVTFSPCVIKYKSGKIDKKIGFVAVSVNKLSLQ